MKAVLLFLFLLLMFPWDASSRIVPAQAVLVQVVVDQIAIAKGALPKKKKKMQKIQML